MTKYKLPKKRQKVWVANITTGGEERYLDEMVPEGKVPIWKKIKTILWIILAFLILILLLYFRVR